MRQLVAGIAAMATLGLSSGCGDRVGDPRPQWRITVATDAPVPQLGDRLLIEVIDANDRICAGCRRQFAVGAVDDWPISFGVVPPASGSALRLRARLYRASYTGGDGLPQGTALIDALGLLPEPSDVALVLSADCFGITDLDPSTSCDPALGQNAPLQPLEPTPELSTLPRPGSWTHAAPLPCEQAPPAGMECVEGGVFLLGHPEDAPPVEGGAPPTPERLVKVTPFALDHDEVTVAEARPLLSKMTSTPSTTEPGVPPRFDCTLSAVAGTSDGLPLNCISRDEAAELCELMNKRLPTEVEWEYAASRRQAESTYPWGEDDEICDHAVVARGNDLVDGEDGSCTSVDDIVSGGLQVGGDPDDATGIGLRNLAGNASEWVMDDFAPYTDESCWPSGQLLLDPVCKTDSAMGVARGGNWQLSRTSARSTTRRGLSPETKVFGVGLRCALSM